MREIDRSNGVIRTKIENVCFNNILIYNHPKSYNTMVRVFNYNFYIDYLLK